ncbi:MAG: class I SAM-dependent methyltransferase [Oligoflexia bacterium]|nr:class I SAM-dependent methyltransferase [Oligoflexia bacterium]
MNQTRMPEPDQFGFVKTFNNTGYMTTYLDEVSQAWVSSCAKSAGLNIDIGAAYGVATLPALQLSNATIMAVDLDPGHLEVLTSRAKELGVEDRLITIDADFPNGLEKVEDNSVSNILICRVLHFFDGQRLQESINWCSRKLVKGGRIFLVNETPYLKNFQSFIPIYEERRKQGHEFPGFIEDVKKVAPERAPFLPPQMHLLDADVLTRVCEKAGLKVERSVVIPRPNFPVDIQLDGRESVGVIAAKT